VDEPTDTGGLGAVSSPNQPTNYTYDVLNNLLTVVQASNTTQQCGGAPNCSQTRTFVYDSLSRLKSATNPESGLIQYVYDNNSNLTQKTDARLVVTNYIYDALNRVTNRNYTAPGGLANYQATPNVSYTYDNLPNAKGKLTKVSSSTSTTEYTAFDILGRVTAHKQTTDGNNYTTGYVYNLSGALIEETYPSNRKVKNTLDADGYLAQVQSQKNATDIFRNYAKQFCLYGSGCCFEFEAGKWKV
jgi:YD repeat-containing protein